MIIDKCTYLAHIFWLVVCCRGRCNRTNLPQYGGYGVSFCVLLLPRAVLIANIIYFSYNIIISKTDLLTSKGCSFYVGLPALVSVALAGVPGRLPSPGSSPRALSRWSGPPPRPRRRAQLCPLRLC